MRRERALCWSGDSLCKPPERTLVREWWEVRRTDGSDAPDPDGGEAQAALDEFFEAVRGLRVRCGIRDVQMIAVVNVVDPDAPGGVTSAIGGWHIGNPAIAPRLLAFQAGRYERERAEELESYRQQGLTSPEIK